MSDEYDPMPSSRRPKQTPTTIGNHKLKPATLMMGYGFDPALSEGSLKAPIFLTSTFVFETAAHGKRFFRDGRADKPHFDLEAFVVARAASAGIGSVEALGLDTYGQADRFYSYRRATHRGEGDYGRQISLIAIGD